MRFLSAMGTLKQHTADTFTPTPLSSSYISTFPLAAAIIHLSVFPHLPKTPRSQIINTTPAPTSTPSSPNSQNTSPKTTGPTPTT